MKNNAKNRGRISAIKDIMTMCATTPSHLWLESINDIHGIWLCDLKTLEERATSQPYEEAPGDTRRGIKHYTAAIDLLEVVRTSIETNRCPLCHTVKFPTRASGYCSEACEQEDKHEN